MDKQSRISSIAIPDEIVMSKIYLIRRLKVILDKDLAILYGIETKRLKEQVRRNIDRFPEDFMFQLNDKENKQIKNSVENKGRGEHSKYTPYAFTEYGVLMLSTVLKSELAIKVNIQIIRVYVYIREIGSLQKDIFERLDGMDEKLANCDDKIMLLYDHLRQFEKLKQAEMEKQNRPLIGFR